LEAQYDLNCVKSTVKTNQPTLLPLRSMCVATMGAGGQYPPPYKGEGDEESTHVTKSI